MNTDRGDGVGISRGTDLLIVSSIVSASIALSCPCRAENFQFNLDSGSAAVYDPKGSLDIKVDQSKDCLNGLCYYNFLFKNSLVLTARFIDRASVYTDPRKPGLFLIRGRTPDFNGTILIAVGDPRHPEECHREEHGGELLTRKGFTVDAIRTEQVFTDLGCVSVSTNIQTR